MKKCTQQIVQKDKRKDYLIWFKAKLFDFHRFIAESLTQNKIWSVQCNIVFSLSEKVPSKWMILCSQYQSYGRTYNITFKIFKQSNYKKHTLVHQLSNLEDIVIIIFGGTRTEWPLATQKPLWGSASVFKSKCAPLPSPSDISPGSLRWPPNRACIKSAAVCPT